MKSNSEVILLLLFLFQQNCNASKSEVAIDYLKKFGYISSPGPGDIPQNSPGNNPGLGDTPHKPRNGSSESVAEAVKSFQKFAGLEATGKVDEDTLKLMKLPRCGVKDFVPGVSHGNIGRYQTQGSRWEKRSLTYRVTQYSRKMTGALVNADVRRAFKYWSDVTNLKFVSKERGDVDIEIGFFTFSHTLPCAWYLLTFPGNLATRSLTPHLGRLISFNVSSSTSPVASRPANSWKVFTALETLSEDPFFGLPGIFPGVFPRPGEF